MVLALRELALAARTTRNEAVFGRGDQECRRRRSWMFDDRVPHVLDEDFTPKRAIDIRVKDLALVLNPGKSLGMPLPVPAVAFQVVIMAAARAWRDRR